MMINIENLSKSYGNKKVLNNINLSLEKGKVYGIVGENGAGKTTLFRCIAGLEPYYGKIESELDKIKDRTGLLATHPYFFSKITGWEYLQLLSVARKIKQQDFNQKNIFNLPLNQYASTYSTGMKKKLALMGVLIQKNDFYILDEPFNGVDIQSNIIITEIIKELKSLNKTVIISSHIFSTLNDTCDEIYLLKNGQFTKRVTKDKFSELEQEMIGETVGDSIGKLGLE